MKIYAKFLFSILLIVFFAFASVSCNKIEQDKNKPAAGSENKEPDHFGSAMFPDNPVTLMIPGICETLDIMALGGSADTIRIGVAGAHSGELASYGLPTVNAVKLVVDDINSNGGLLGKQIELVIEDDVCKPEVATNTATKLVSEKVVAVIGHICSGATESALGIYKAADIVCISPSATKTELTTTGEYPNFFRTISNDAAQAKLQVIFAINTLHVKKVAIIHDKQAYGKGAATLSKQRSEERRVGKECRRLCRSRWSPYH
jgi:ABC-type branched-subunit amino acid transport system substrate-binding protein